MHGRFADVISRAKDELVTHGRLPAVRVDAKRTAFQMRHGIDAWDEAISHFKKPKD